VAIANALQLEVARRHDSSRRYAKFEVAELIHCRSIEFLLLDTLLYAVTLTFDLEHLRCIPCDVMKLCTEFERNQAIHSGVIAISIFDLTTLNMCHVG